MNDNHRIVVRHYTLDTPAGNTATAVSAAVREGNPGFRIHSDHTVTKLDGSTGAFPLLGQIGSNDGRPLLSPERLLFRLHGLLSTPDERPVPETALLCRPTEQSPRRAELEKSLLPMARTLLTQYGVRGIQEVCDDTLPAVLTETLGRMQQGHSTSLLIVAIDSLVNTSTLNERLPHHDVRTTDNAHGRVLSEGLCALWLEAVPNDDSMGDGTLTLSPPISTTEPDDQLPDQRWHSALAQACSEALGSPAPGDPADPTPRPALVMLARAQTMTDELIWYQTNSTLWPLRLSPRANLAMRKGEQDAPQPDPLPAQEILRPAQVLGDTGVSTLPLAIILAAERLRCPQQPASQCLLLDNIGRQRLALLVNHQRPTRSDNIEDDTNAGIHSGHSRHPDPQQVPHA